MAHQLRYYKEIESQGHTWRVDFYQDTEDTVDVQVIGPVLQGLRLVMQGDQADIDTPIVKTSLEMTFIDAPDMEGEGKTGYWEEFYTSSATEWMVKLWKDGVIEWSGFVTPDSFSETLQYRGSVSIIARDNLGTMQEIDCDLENTITTYGRVYVDHVIKEAFAASKCAMTLEYDEAWLPRHTDVPSLIAFFSRLNWQSLKGDSFDGKTWWQALEEVLYATGLVMRYVGGNKFSIMSLRDMPKVGNHYWWDVPLKNSVFKSFATRELMYGIKGIDEVQEFNKSDSDTQEYNQIKYGDKLDESFCNGYLIYYYNGNTSEDMVVPSYGYQHPQMGEISEDKSVLLDVSKYSLVEGESSIEYGAWDDDSIFYMGLNPCRVGGTELDAILDRPLEFKRAVMGAGETVSFRMVLSKPVALTPDGKGVMNLPVQSFSQWSSHLNVTYDVLHKDVNGNTQYIISNGYRQFSEFLEIMVNGISLEFVVENISVPSAGTVIMQIKSLSTDINATNITTVRKDCRGCYVRIKNVSFESKIPEEELLKIIDKNTFKTNYSDRYAIRITREPKYAINASNTPAVAYLENAILSNTDGIDHRGADQWIFPQGRSYTTGLIGISLTRLIHQQLLAYFSKPNNILSGELMDAGGQVPDFSSLWMWNGKKHMLMSGSLNILTGRMENAVLREFTRYDHMWETWINEDDEYIVIDYPQTNSLVLRARSNRVLSINDVTNLPLWLAVRAIQSKGHGEYNVILRAMANESGQERSAIFKVDTAFVKVTQRAAGDYNIDYGEDYS